MLLLGLNWDDHSWALDVFDCTWAVTSLPPSKVIIKITQNDVLQGLTVCLVNKERSISSNAVTISFNIALLFSINNKIFEHLLCTRLCLVSGTHRGIQLTCGL